MSFASTPEALTSPKSRRKKVFSTDELNYIEKVGAPVKLNFSVGGFSRIGRSGTSSSQITGECLSRL